MIEVDGVGYAFDGRVALDDVSFRVEPGEHVVLLGANGCGKTTLLRLLDGLLFARRGQVRYRGVALERAALGKPPLRGTFRREVAHLFQNPEAMVFNPTVYDEIAFGLRQAGSDDVDDRVRRWADAFGLGIHLDRVPFQLSRGEMQKVCLAALLAVEPAVLLLDEPTASLDPRSSGWLVDFLRGLDATTIVATHNVSMAGELGDRTLVLSERHRLIYDGAVDDLLRDRERLVEANLVHVHGHRHGEIEHRHYHTHDWD